MHVTGWVVLLVGSLLVRVRNAEEECKAADGSPLLLELADYGEVYINARDYDPGMDCKWNVIHTGNSDLFVPIYDTIRPFDVDCPDDKLQVNGGSDICSDISSYVKVLTPGPIQVTFTSTDDGSGNEGFSLMFSTEYLPKACRDDAKPLVLQLDESAPIVVYSWGRDPELNFNFEYAAGLNCEWHLEYNPEELEVTYRTVNNFWLPDCDAKLRVDGGTPICSEITNPVVVTPTDPNDPKIIVSFVTTNTFPDGGVGAELEFTAVYNSPACRDPNNPLVIAITEPLINTDVFSFGYGSESHSLAPKTCKWTITWDPARLDLSYETIGDVELEAGQLAIGGLEHTASIVNTQDTTGTLQIEFDSLGLDKKGFKLRITTVDYQPTGEWIQIRTIPSSNADCPGNDIRNLPVHLDTCKAMCHLDTDCKSFVYWNNTCFLKNDFCTADASLAEKENTDYLRFTKQGADPDSVEYLTWCPLKSVKGKCPLHILLTFDDAKFQETCALECARNPSCKAYQYRLRKSGSRCILHYRACGQNELTNRRDELYTMYIKEKCGGKPPVSTYFHWGTSICPRNADLVFPGFMAGSPSYSRGGSAQMLCLRTQPTVDGSAYSPNPAAVAGGAEFYMPYGSASSIFTTERHPHNQDPDCALCKIVIPAKKNCPRDWDLQYWGYLMSSGYTSNGQQSFICMDSNPELRHGGQRGDEKGVHLVTVRAFCGSVHCPPYKNERELTCAVCSHPGPM